MEIGKWSYTHKKYDIYFESQRSRIISNSNFFSFNLGMNQRPSDPEADDITICHQD